MTRRRIAPLIAPVKITLPVVALLVLVSGCSDDTQCLVEPRCHGEKPSTPPPPSPAELEIASFSVILYHTSPGDDCFDGCEQPVIDVVEKTGLGRASIASVTMWGLLAVTSPGSTCTVEPGQHRAIRSGWYSPVTSSTIGEERTAIVTYKDGTGRIETLSASTLVTPGVYEPGGTTACRAP